MEHGRVLVVGGRAIDPEVVALLELTSRAGLDVRAAAIRPPQESAGWHRLTPPQTTTTLAGMLQRVTRSVLRGASAELADALAHDPWLDRQVRDARALSGPAQTGSSQTGSSQTGSAQTGPGGVIVVGADDTATQALAAWSARAGVAATVLTWDKGAALLVDELVTRAGATPGEAEPAAHHAGVDPGGMTRVVVATSPGQGPDPRLAEVLPTLRAKVVHLSPGAAVPSGTDVLVLDGMGPAVARLATLPATVRVVHLPRPTDRMSPWTGLLASPAYGPPGELVRVGTDGEEQDLATALVGTQAARLLALRRERRDEEALALAAELLDATATDPVADASTADPAARSAPDPVALREIVYLARVTGSPTLELAALRALQRSAGTVAPDRLEQAVATVEARLRETELTWLPQLPPTPVEPVPGRVVHLLKVTLPQRQAGYSVRSHHTLAALVDRGVDVVGVAMPPDPDGDLAPQGSPAPPEETVLDGVRYVIPPPLPAGADDPPGGRLQAATSALLPVVAELRPAVLHVHSGHRGYDLGVVGAALAGALGVPWVYEVRGFFESTWTSDPERAERGEVFARRSAREADLASRADATVTLAETMRADLVGRGVPAERVHVVPNAVDPARLAPVERDAQLARELDGVGRFTFGYVSNLDHDREQVEDLVRAAILLHSRGRPVHAVVVGTGRREEELRALTHELGATGLVTFTGRVPHDQVAHYYGLLDVLVVPRSDERAARLVTPLKPFEAMAMGVPVVVSAQPALLEVIGDGERGWSYPAGDAAALADLLGTLADDPAGRAEVADRARAWVTAERTWAANARSYAELYATLAGPDLRPGPR